MARGVPEDLRIADLSTFLEVARVGSISGAARALGVQPPQVSKAVARLERRLAVPLLVRGARGVAITDAGRRLVPQLGEVFGRLAELRSLAGEPRPVLTVVGTAFVSTLLMPHIGRALPGFRLRSLELPPGVASALASQQLFDIAITTEEAGYERSWVATPLGTLRKALFASPAKARELGRRPVALDRLRSETFVTPIYSYNGHVVPGDDGFPLAYGERRGGHETETLMVALALAEISDQLIFAPALAARAAVERGALVEIPVAGVEVSTPLFLVCHAERVLASAQRELTDALRAALAAPDAARAETA